MLLVLVAHIFHVPVLCSVSHCPYNSKENGQSVSFRGTYCSPESSMLNKIKFKVDTFSNLSEVWPVGL